ncbi:glucose 1-dehydrogenase [Rhodococcus sp. NPDC059968]|uniref:glucose 1-dehydrogenase n=1 Tax=Rhodococcus sp. NPDC059968 TaxID=3347017 RepID=UPI0036731616
MMTADKSTTAGANGRLTGRVAIVTGGGAGIGYAIAARLAAEGARVVIAERDEQYGKSAAAALGVEFTKTDVRHRDSIDEAISFTLSRFGQLDILVNNAGVTRFLDFLDITEGDWDLIQAVNARGVFFFMQAAARVMAEKGQGGAIINIASIAGKGYGSTSSAAYAASKAAVIALTRIGAVQLASDGIRVNAICPGITVTHNLLGDESGNETDVTPVSKAWSGAETDEGRARFRALVQTIPLGRPSRPEDMGSLAAFLASDESASITGQSLNVDGGLVFD